MIANQAANFAFLHIPKCAGITIHSLFRDKDDFGGSFHGTKSDARLGMYDGNHVPLKVLKETFPDAFAHIAPLEKFAIIRDPMQRFQSAMAQRIRMFTDHEPATIGTGDLEAELVQVMDHLCGAGPMLPREFAHFMRQADFVELDGRRVVENLYPIEQTDAVVVELSRRLGVDRDASARSNVTAWRRVEVLDTLRWLSFLYRRVLPESHIRRVRELLQNSLAVPALPTRLQKVLGSETVRSFVERQYARDFDLRAEVLEQAAARANAASVHGPLSGDTAN